MYGLEWRNIRKRRKNTHMTLEWAKKQVHHNSTYNISFLTRHMIPYVKIKKTILTHRYCVSLCNVSADDVTIEYTARYNCDAGTWKFHLNCEILILLMVFTAGLIRMTVTKWWHHDIDTLSILLFLCEGNQPVTSWFVSQRGANMEIWCFICWS